MILKSESGGSVIDLEKGTITLFLGDFENHDKIGEETGFILKVGGDKDEDESRCTL